jgi:hypothetical protein
MITLDTPNPRYVRRYLSGDDTIPGLAAALRAEDWGKAYRLLTVGRGTGFLGTSTKVERGEGIGVLTSVIYLSPFKASGVANMCPFATDGCIESCLGEGTGRMSMPSSRRGRLRKTLLLHLFPLQAVAGLQKEATALHKRAERMGKRAAIRPNGTSDFDWERWRGVLMDYTPGVVWYDYTKAPRGARDLSVPNYTLTYSVSERPSSVDDARDYVRAGQGAAVVVAGADDSRSGAKETAQTVIESGSWMGMPTTDGDAHDYRPDDRGTLSVLYAKGRALLDRSGFVKRLAW